MSEHKSGKGYFLSITFGGGYYIPNALHVERDDEMLLFESDEQAAKAAERDGVKLIYGMDGIPDGIYIDTPENRDVIFQGLKKYPELSIGPAQKVPTQQGGLQLM